MDKTFKTLVFLLVFSIPSSMWGAATIHLKNGKVRRGQIIEQSESRVRLDVGAGNIDVFNISEIEKIVSEVRIEIDVVHLRNGSILKGKILEETRDRLKLRTSDGSVLAYFLSEIEKKVKEEDVIFQTWVPSSTPPDTLKQGKSPALALILSMLVVPGSGQWYNGDVGKGAGFFLMGLTGYVLMLSGADDVVATDAEEGGGKLLGGLAIAFTSAIWGGVDAYKTAKRINRGRAELQLIKTPKYALSLIPDSRITQGGNVTTRLLMKLEF